MRRSEHKTTFLDVLAFLELNGPTHAEDLGAHFWPDKVGFGPARGGPVSVAVSASWLLSKLARRRLVEKNMWRGGDGKWSITSKGREYIYENSKEPPNGKG